MIADQDALPGLVLESASEPAVGHLGELLRATSYIRWSQASLLYARRTVGEEVALDFDESIRWQAADRLAPILSKMIPEEQLQQLADTAHTGHLTDMADRLAEFCAPVLAMESWSKARLQSLFKPAPNQPDIPDAFPGGEARIPSNPLLRVGFSANSHAGGKRARKLVGWKTNELGAPYYENYGNKGGSIQCYPRPAWGPQDAPPTTDNLWEFIEGLSARTADVALAVLAQLCESTHGDKPKFPMLDPVLITSNAILKYKGIRRWGSERQGLYEWISEEMKRLQSLNFDVLRYKEFDRATMKVETWDCKSDRLFDIVEVVTYQENFLDAAEIVETSWRVRAGQWAFWWLNSEGRVWMGKMAGILLKLDHRERRGPALLAKKIGQRMLVLHSALSSSKREPSEPIDRIISNLLEEIGELPILEERDKNWAGRERDRFDEAMAVLQQVGVFSSVEWPSGFGPDAVDGGKGWVTQWLQAKVRITMPDTAPESKSLAVPPAGSRARRPQSAGRTAKPALSEFANIRGIRTEAGWTQAALAKHLGIDQSWVSKIEHGQAPSPEFAGKLTSWIERMQREKRP